MIEYTIDSIGNIKICQPKEGYRFSVDALILAHFINLKRIKTIVDVGAGTGIIGIVLAKKYPEAKVTMIEIQPDISELAKESLRINKMENRIRVLCSDAKEFNETGFDLIVSNPPFRRAGTGRISPKEIKALARHEISLTITDIAKIGQRVLRNRGRLCMIHLPERLTEIVRVMSRHGLEIKRLRFVHSKSDSEAKMVLVEAVKGGRVAVKVDPPLFIYQINEHAKYTEEMERIYRI